MLTPEKIKTILTRFDEVEKLLAENPDKEAYVRLAQEFAELQPLAQKISQLEKLNKEQKQLEEMLTSQLDNDMKQMALAEQINLKKKLHQLENELQILLLPKDEADSRGIILELRAGTGGNEAAIFVGDLFRMYQRHCEHKKWQLEIISQNLGDAGGYKEIIANINGAGVFGRLKFESGVHRVQRVPQTESQGRIHTSAATVAVLPQAQEIDIKINNEDLRIDTMRASGAGGQHVNTTDSAVRITHLPTGLVVVASEKSQHQNRAAALKELRSRLYDQQRQQQQQAQADKRKHQVGSGDRSERIRTYNYPQGRISDHRINLTLYKLEKILAGQGLDEIIDNLIADHQATQLAEYATPEK